MLLGAYPQRSAEENFANTAKQAYLGFANTITVAAFEEIEATPTKGFDPTAVDEILNLKEKEQGRFYH